MCDASDFAVGAVLGQRIDEKFKPIYYASKTLNNAQEHYTTTEKELLTVVFSFDKFCMYLILSKTIVYTDHSALKYLFSKQDAKPRLISASITRRKVYEAGFFWPRIFKDDKDYVMRCDACQRSGNISSRSKMPHNNIQLFARFGVPKALISDRGTHLCNSQLEKALQKYEVTHNLSTVYHPQTNGQTEVTNRAIKRILERSVGYNRKNWSKKLDDTLWAFRTAYKTPNGCTLFRLVYGKDCHLPMEIEHKAYWALKQCNMGLTAAAKNHFMELNELMELRDGAYKNTRIYKERTKKWYDSRLRGDKDFKVGDKFMDMAYRSPV
ncbi:reverse transcriptase domain-containing protein [Tanacetum coccineum]